MEITCPSGLKLDVRPWNNNDQLELIDANNVILRMAEIATLKCIDPGPYSFNAESRPAWSEVSIADMTAANVLIRGITDTGEYDIDRQCSNPSCRIVQGLTIDCKDVHIFPATEEGIQHLRTGAPILKRIRTATAGEVELAIRILRGSHMGELDRYQKQDRRTGLKAQTCLAIQSIRFLEAKDAKGEPRKEMASPKAIMEFWSGETWSITDLVRDTIEEAEGGPDLIVEWACKEFGCKKEQHTTVPLDPAFYGLDLEGKLVKRHRRYLAARSADSTMPSESST
jgi:hypothetical protein